MKKKIKKKIEEEKDKKIKKQKEKEENEKAINEEMQKRQKKEDQIKNDESKMKETKIDLDNKEALIKSKNEEVNEMTKILEDIFIKDLDNLEKERKKLEEELKKYKDNAIRHFLIIKIINEEIEKLTLNKSTVNSVSKLIEQLKLNSNFIDNRSYFDEIINQYKDIDDEIEQAKKLVSNNNQNINQANDEQIKKVNDIYKRYEIDADSIRKIEKPDQAD